MPFADLQYRGPSFVKVPTALFILKKDRSAPITSNLHQLRTIGPLPVTQLVRLLTKKWKLIPGLV